MPDLVSCLKVTIVQGGREQHRMMEDMEQMDLSLAITSHGVSLPPFDSLPPAHVFTLHAQFTLVTQQYI